ncbi:MAG: alpha/beta hydrolase [Oscillospiraceae bacterium]|nr:alpha/beta hydrolase [Oscillospiraceae bacterium]MBR6595146.1 alpha/beta hydrolase [Oscillospiraceae bacterium]
MRTDHSYDSCGKGSIHYCKWTPDGEIKGILQIVHGIAEFVERYDDFANYLNSQGYLVVAEDHMGHGKSIEGGSTQGFFHGGWFAAVEDTMKLMKDTMEDHPGVPYVLFGHSMGSFMARTILAKYPDCGITAAVICGTGWQPTMALPALIKVVEGICKKNGEENISEKLQNMVFGGYNKRIDNPRTPYDWLTRDDKIVDAYIAHPLCGFTPACGLLRDMMKGIYYNQQGKNLKNMKKHLPVFFIAGSEDPVGPYGKGVEKAASVFRKSGMINVACKIYPNCRHEILNELNREAVYEDVAAWLKPYVIKE